ncbi:MAG: MBL fold metallo-hydrolase [Candidatus Brocadiae bacterium]|nr:MBL fold metallo-hydrolase [Candidatus Brocadiia bacterium]
MAEDRYVTYYQVGSGNSSLISLGGDDFILVDLCESEDGFSVLDHLRNVLPKQDGGPFLSVLCVTHAHDDHIRGVKELLDEFGVGEIWYPNYDRFQMEEGKQSDDYKALHKEIDRRRGADSEEPGEVAKDLTAMEELTELCDSSPAEFRVRVLSPYRKDEQQPENDINHMSLVLNVEVSGHSFLYAGDSYDRVWTERIIPYMLEKNEYEDWASADVLLASHHGSHTFFDSDREQCLKDPKNSEALGYIEPRWLAVSAATRFPASRDKSGDDPPHYAAYKWYKQHFVDRDLAEEDDEHPDAFLYTADGHIKFSLTDGDWEVDRDWRPDGGDSGDGDDEDEKGGYTPRTRVGEHAPRKFG